MSDDPLPMLPMWRVDHIEPSPAMLALRANGPIHRVRFPSGHEGWWVTGYDEAKAVLSDAAFRPAGMPPTEFTPDSVILGSPGWLVSHEGIEHARLRTIVAPAFSNRRVKLLAEQVETIAAQLFETLAAQAQPADLRRHLSFPLPAMVISALMGVPYEDHTFFAGLSDEVMTHQHESGPRRASRVAWEELRAYIRGKMRGKREEQGDDLLTDLLAAVDQGKASEEEAIGLAAGMLVAGHESTVAQIEFGLLALLRHPQQRERLVTDPSLAESAVEEILRMYPPGAGWDGIMRYPRVDVDIAGVHIPAESKVLVGLPATAFDPRHFDDPEIFDIGRDAKPHLAFSYGPHYCIGVALARLELKVVFGSIFQRFPALRLAVAPEALTLRKEIITGGFEAFPVRW
ncbi:cytochrome P450 [Xanthomonas oryzae]|uniref:Cytochrome P450 BJ-1 n=2 Tax=Xanthomonas oryzae TaxID=347 RepID=G7TIP9_XANOB|nr:cytochrome P450 [Xanthomonas oryzae]AEQ94342.1 cytochrome P450 BJ-1 [Xanthomonas oryzae pv. oryzicola BLS256]AKN95048.1 cytochrome P450 [Xanthomonas oryzae pv. oryzicola]AKN98777.1 cytochrome P450 [Xanthomonas oryzae pv. oryzicola]AKO13999.1 cytochrome P450 [Xanthomonas oryzae pv. oryzicola]AKO17736.1 cytochrome P450 [Xanthomonas oryzae pv. oryzicola]